jgi:lipid-binding SYLF domain-containing protein
MESPLLLSRRAVISAVTVSASAAIVAPWSAFAASKVDNEIDKALRELYAEAPAAKDLSTRATAILVFPRITKAGFLFGGAYGEGVLRKDGVDVANYNSVAASYGLQAGVQSFGYALFFMNDQALSYLDNSAGWEIGSGPSVVVVDKGAAKKLSSTTLTQDVYAFIFGQKGLMAGLGLEGTKISRIR